VLESEVWEEDRDAGVDKTVVGEAWSIGCIVEV
jgi:hypothetical protein